MSNDRKFPGKMISMLYPSRSGAELSHNQAMELLETLKGLTQ